MADLYLFHYVERWPYSRERLSVWFFYAHAQREYILKHDLDNSDCYTRIQSLQEKAKRLSEIRNDFILEVEKIKEMLKSSEK